MEYKHLFEIDKQDFWKVYKQVIFLNQYVFLLQTSVEVNLLETPAKQAWYSNDFKKIWPILIQYSNLSLELMPKMKSQLWKGI